MSYTRRLEPISLLGHSGNTPGITHSLNDELKIILKFLTTDSRKSVYRSLLLPTFIIVQFIRFTMARKILLSLKKSYKSAVSVAYFRISWPKYYLGWSSNPLHSKFVTENKNIYLHFMSFLHIDITQIVGILPQVTQEVTFSALLISWLPDIPPTQGARALTTMIFTMLNRINTAPHIKG